MNANKIYAQYKRHPEESLERLAERLAKKKWKPEDIVREDKSHRAEFAETGADKEYIDRYIIATIAEQYSRKAKIKQDILRRAWEMKHPDVPFTEALPQRMTRFRQYEEIPFPEERGPKKKLTNLEWNNYLKSACSRLSEK